MNKSKNTFLKSKMNKDIDARIVPNNEYRNAVNVQVNKSEGSNAGSLENILGNIKVADVAVHTGASGLYCIGFLEDESTGITYLFFTNYQDKDPNQITYAPNSSNYIISFNTINSELITLVQGAFLNFSKTHPIYGVNIVENLLFWTDNRNQPRKINVDLANSNSILAPTYYTNEDQISVAKYNPFQCIDLWDVSRLSTSVNTGYETTMKDVSSKNLPNGGNGKLNAAVPSSATTIILKNFIGDFQVQGAADNNYDEGSVVSYIDAFGIVKTSTSIVTAASFNSNLWTLTISPGITALPSNTDIILNANPYYDSKFAGDPTYLDDKFVRFGYRFKFVDNEYSLFSTFTQAAFIPKQDGYFMYVKKDDLKEVNNESEASRSTIVNFVENKVDQIKLRIPLPFRNYNMFSSLKVTDIDVLYKESDQIPVKVIDTIPAEEVFNASGVATVKNNTTTVNVDVINILGGIKIGSYVTGFGITTDVTVVGYTPENPNVNPSTSGIVELSSAQTLLAGQQITIGEPNFHVYDYQSKKPFRTLPEKDLIRVYDKTPVRALAQEISGNRVIYGNYQNKHSAPEFIDYNVAITPKSSFSLNGSSADIDGNYSAGVTIINIINLKPGPVFIGMIVICDGVPEGTVITNVSGNQITLSNPTTAPILNLTLIIIEKGGTEENTTSKIEYPNSSVKTNRNYQVGVVISDRYGRQSGVILSNNKDISISGNQTFIGSTIYSPYNTIDTEPDEWPGDSIKLIFNNEIATLKNTTLGLPGVYNGDATSGSYNPLGWYSYKIVVKQTEQEYYNVYLPGIMAGYPEDLTLEQGQTSHIVLTSDNINKVPRDLNEVGPTQDQFRSSVKLYGRVENSTTIITTTNVGLSNLQYYPGREFDIAITISPMNDLFGYDPLNQPEPNYFPQFYTYDSNPYIARISTATKIGQAADVNYTAVSAFVAASQTTSTILLYNVNPTNGGADIEIGDNVTGPGFPDDLVTIGPTPFFGPSPGPQNVATSQGTSGNILFFSSGTFNLAPVFVGDEVSSVTGVPNGTVITEIILGTAPADVEIIVNQTVVVGNGAAISFQRPARIVVNQSIVVNVDDRINIASSSKPGLQYLAVYETDPVQSLLDIFWESSSTGVIEDINNILTNEGTSGEAAGDISPFNDDPFTEALRQDPTTLEYPNITTAPFGLVNNFLQPIPAGDIQTPLSLNSVTNGFGEDVQTIYINNDFGVTPYITPCFSFEETASGTNLFNLKIAEGFTRNIYFGTQAELHTFNFNFTAEVNGVVFEKNVELTLGNVAPAFYTWEGTSFNALRTQANVTDIQVYNPINANNVLPGWKVFNSTNPSSFPANLEVTGTGYTIGTNTAGLVGEPNNPGYTAFQPTPTGVTQNSTVINFLSTESGQFGGTLQLIEVGNVPVFRPDCDIFSTSDIPLGTYVESFVEGSPGTVTFNNAITTTKIPVDQQVIIGWFTFGDQIQFFAPNFLQVDQASNTTEGDLIYAYEAPTWNNCPIQPFFPGSPNIEVIGKLQGVNGAGFNINDIFPTNQNNKKWRDLTMSITNQYVGPDPSNTVDYFSLTNGGSLVGNDGLGIGPGGLQAIATVGETTLINNSWDDDSMPAGVYTLELELSDPGDSVACQVSVNTGLNICQDGDLPPGKFGDAPYGVVEYTVVATPTTFGLTKGAQLRTWKYIAVTICSGQGGVYTSLGGNGSNGVYIWSAGGGNANGIGTTIGNSSWQNAINQSGAGAGGNLQLPTSFQDLETGVSVTGEINPGESQCAGNWAMMPFWDGFGTFPDDVFPGTRDNLLQLPCTNFLEVDGPNGSYYTTTITKTAGDGTGLPLDPPVQNYAFTQ